MLHGYKIIFVYEIKKLVEFLYVEQKIHIPLWRVK